MTEQHQFTFREIRQSKKDMAEIRWIALQLAHSKEEAAQLREQWVMQAAQNPRRPLGPALDLARRALREKGLA